MNIATLTDKAMELRTHFDRVAQASGRAPWTKEQIMQGFVVDVGALMKLVMAKSGARDAQDLDRKLGHELADCLWSVLVLARCYGLNLEQEFLTMIQAVSGEPSPSGSATVNPTADK